MKKILLLSILFFLPVSVSAAELSVAPPLGFVHAGDSFSVDVLLDAEGGDINALEGEIAVSDNVRIESVRTNTSIVSLWAEKPEITDNSVVFAGVIPGGYSGTLGAEWIGARPGTVFSIVLSAVSPGIASVSFKDGRVLANDGQGSELPLRALGLDLRVGERRSGVAAPLAGEDTVPPEPFTPLITDGAPFGYPGNVIVFSAFDKDSEVVLYEAAHAPSLISDSAASSLSWKRAESPYAIPAFEVGKYHYIRATDAYGNMRIAVAPPVESRPVEAFWWIMLIGAGLALGFVLMRALKRSS